MSLTSHTGLMKPNKLQIGTLLAALLSLVAGWAVVIWVALQVSEIVLNTLHQIVELAQMS